MQNALYMINGVKTMLNKVILMGRLTKDPEIRYTQSGVMVANFTLAIDRRIRKDTDEKETDFINCVAWDRQAEFMKEYFTKGMMAIVEGRIQTRSWNDSKDGSKRYATEVVAGIITFGETKAARERAGYAPSGNAPTNTPTNTPTNAPTENDFSELEDDGDVPF